MKKSINRNIVWSQFIARIIANHNIKNVCISPGSRNTPLIFAFSEIKKFKKFVIVDERSSGFFALGLAKKSQTPTVVITTSGTATAELYPAIIEAYNSRVPLIILTADRPDYLRNTGANQTINQENIYANHIRKFLQLPLPSVGISSFKKLANDLSNILSTSLQADPGPVHINIPFEEPLTPSAFTDKIDQRLIQKFDRLIPDSSKYFKGKSDSKKNIAKILFGKSPIIFVGWGDFPNSFSKDLFGLAEKIHAPILADGLSFARTTNGRNVICNHPSFLITAKARKFFEPTSIIQFGNAPTSKSMLKFFEQTDSKIYNVNEFGDLKDPSRKAKVIKQSPQAFCRSFQNQVFKTEQNWLEKWIAAENISNILKQKHLKQSGIFFEPIIVDRLSKMLPAKSNLMISNSLPPRDWDYFFSSKGKAISLFANRGASGIDGITSTGAGIAMQTKQKTILFTGDLAFFHDLNGLATLKKYKIPLVVILINNGGGSIFEMLPVHSEKIDFEKYFKTPLDLNFKSLITGFDGNHFLVKTVKEFDRTFSQAIRSKKFSVLEIKTDSKKSIQFRNKYWQSITEQIEKWIDENSI